MILNIIMKMEQKTTFTRIVQKCCLFIDYLNAFQQRLVNSAFPGTKGRGVLSHDSIIARYTFQLTYSETTFQGLFAITRFPGERMLVLSKNGITIRLNWLEATSIVFCLSDFCLNCFTWNLFPVSKVGG